MIVPVPVPGMDGVGALVVGRRFDGRIVRGVDVPFLEALGSMAGLAAARVRLLDAGEAASEPPPAQECPICGSLAGSGEVPGCECGAAYVETDVPQLLAGKYRLTRRLGTGGAGTVYLARDLRLDRDIAIKTIAGTSALRLMQLKPEAWAMATVAHPAVAQIHGVESWWGRPFLVVEFLSGGTLADRLEQGPSPPGRVRPRHRRTGGRPGGAAREGLPARRHQAEQHRIHVERVAETAGFRPGPHGARLGRRGRHAAQCISGGAGGPPARRSRRRVVPVRGLVRGGVRPAPFRGRERRRGGGADPAPEPRVPFRAAGGTGLRGRGRVRGVGADGTPVDAADERGGIRRGAPCGPLERIGLDSGRLIVRFSATFRYGSAES